MISVLDAEEAMAQVAAIIIAAGDACKGDHLMMFAALVGALGTMAANNANGDQMLAVAIRTLDTARQTLAVRKPVEAAS